jgi:hypothetical protein
MVMMDYALFFSMGGVVQWLYCAKKDWTKKRKVAPKVNVFRTTSTFVFF